MAVEVFVGDLVVAVCDCLDQLLAVFLRIGKHPGRNLPDLRVETERIGGVILEEIGLHLHEVHEAGEILLGTDGQEERMSVGAQLLAHLLDAGVEICAHPVHLVDKGEARNAVFVGLPPDGLGLGLNPADRTEDRHCAIEDPERTLHFGCEIDVSRRVDDVDAVLDRRERAHRRNPCAGDCSRRDGDAPLAFLLHPVGDRRALVHLPHLVNGA